MNKSGLSRQESTRQHRELIIRESIRLFQSLGYDQTTIRQISANTGLSVGSIYHLFSGKEEILTEYTDAIVDEEVQEPLRLTARNLKHPVDSIVEYACRIAEKYEQIGVELTRIISHRLVPLWGKNTDISSYRVPDSLLRFVAAAQREGTLNSDIPTKEIVEMVHITTTGIITYWINLDTPFPLAEKTRHVLPRVLFSVDMANK